MDVGGLEGSKKGDTLKGINKLKKYLNSRGYLDMYEGFEDDYFDETLETAVKTFQQYNIGFSNENVTGTLNPVTCQLLTHRSCGFADLHHRMVKLEMKGIVDNKDNKPGSSD
ncbi:Peptidoglycan binding-like [Macleaya cordata]|uniref:Peptidoglycan binding-like n=1 Tax=Macleaya cordata TaxID=56857 RepID=A0A200RD87_MACCD|nr:Peptidoglycan binding-like [Macleaya cordata]